MGNTPLHPLFLEGKHDAPLIHGFRLRRELSRTVCNANQRGRQAHRLPSGRANNPCAVFFPSINWHFDNVECWTSNL